MGDKTSYVGWWGGGEKVFPIGMGILFRVERQLSWKNRLHSGSPRYLVNYPYRFDLFITDVLDFENISRTWVF